MTKWPKNTLNQPKVTFIQTSNHQTTAYPMDSFLFYLVFKNERNYRKNLCVVFLDPKKTKYIRLIRQKRAFVYYSFCREQLGHNKLNSNPIQSKF